MKIWLITHSEEIKKTTGTGKLVKEALNDECERIIWSRTEPNKEILQLAPNNTVLVYPYQEGGLEIQGVSSSVIENILILDGTWQQARKMYNQSPYLKQFCHYEIQGLRSVYAKRRNQKETGLCTAEVAIQILKEKRHLKLTALQKKFSVFNQSP
ncbi:DTW domain-containing protein [Marinomonas algarum]|uniref:tRNA-uridine aminocarboxypropyltransferase n=1 Tax=Marinomonas algarum TaxID=2883105 RepID=A0A9X1IPC5_9GAMM|nr:tRNA-uridine aminocarboxypropyltransferase [Marinomonas algarum]MCB5162885.1 DTW domain-containing protein [Marinomonas algarum]